jgi:two-component system sensor histidine kinase TtrS
MRKCKRTGIHLLWLAALLFPTLAASVPQAAVGVLAHRGVDTAIRMWTPTVDYLSEQISDYEFRLVPLDLQETRSALERGELDFILTNPGHYVELEAGYDITRIATLKNVRQGRAFKEFGAVIFTRAGRADIHALADLRGKIFGAVDEGAFGGFQMAWRELKAAGIDPFSDFSELRFSGFPQDNIVLEVRNGKLDAGTVRSDVLEGMAGQGQIELADFRILNPQTADDFPFLHSTRLYPEWAFARARSTPDALASKVAIALLQMPAEHPATRAGDYAGWTVPLSYQPVHDLFMQLGTGPYARPTTFTLLDAIRRYWYWVVLMGFFILFSTSFNILVKRQVGRRTAELTREVAERKHAEQESRKLLGENRILIQKSLAVQESERRYLARELHDELGQCITAIQADARIISERAPEGDAHVATSAMAIQNVAAHLYEVVHTMMRRLRPEMLDDLGLLDTLAEEVDVWRSRQQDTVYELSPGADLSDLGEEINITLYRIVQECLTNIAKHAKARQVMIELTALENLSWGTSGEGRQGIRLVIQDDGVGMDMETPRPGLGLIGMRERVEGLNGHFTVRSKPGAGTTISVELPLTSTKAGA